MSEAVTEDDLFEDAPAAPVTKYPTIKQLATGDKTVKVVYAKGEDNEVVKDTTGRLCIFRPSSDVKKVPDRFNPGSMKPQIQVDVILLTGPPITEVIDKDGDVTGNLDPALVPGDTIPAMFVSQSVLVGQLKQLLTNDKPAGRMSVGRFLMLPAKQAGGNKPWAIGVAVDPKQKAADIALAKKWVKEHPAPDLFEG